MGCTESVDPFVGEERPFTLWGFLDSGVDTQRVRVFTIGERLGLDRSGPIDAEVTSIDLDTGERVTWRDSTVTFYDGSVGHVFWAPFRAEHGHRYRLEARRSDGERAWAEVRVPPPTRIEFDPRSLSANLPVRIVGEAPNILGLEVVYSAIAAYPLNPWPVGTAIPEVRLPVPVSYQETLRRQPGGWVFQINMQQDVPAVEAEFARHCLPDSVVLSRMEIRYLAADSSWMPPGGRFDLDVLVEPGAFSNVENGFGYVGAGETGSERWVPPSEAQRNAGFVLSLPCPMMPSPACAVTFAPCFRCEEPLTPEIRRAYCPAP